MQIAKSKMVTIAIALFVMLLPWPHLVGAQQANKIPRIGYVSATSSANNPGHQIEAFRQGLRDRGSIDGKNVLVEYRYLEGKLDQIPGLVAQLVELRVDMFVLTSLSAIRAAKQATRRFPLS
jgi:putative ABC transport system substrate-binding protein